MRQSTIATPSTGAPPIESGPDRRERRVRDRRSPEWIHCSLGYVLDLSTDGVRILSKKRLAGTMEVRLYDNRTSVTLPGDVIWSHRIGFRQHEVGLQFPDLGEEMAFRLGTLGDRSFC